MYENNIQNGSDNVHFRRRAYSYFDSGRKCLKRLASALTSRLAIFSNPIISELEMYPAKFVPSTEPTCIKVKESVIQPERGV